MKGHRIHLAGTFTNAVCHYVPQEYRYLLESYHYIGNQKSADQIRSFGRRVFLDSGAFSAFTKGAEIDIEGYANYIQKNQDIIEAASVLDSIGDPALTLENQHRLEDLGAEVLPCFHYGDDIEYLERYLEAGYPFITLGGMVPISTGPLEKWLDWLWGDFLTDDQGMPKVKVHGFGLTILRLMLKYPWYSVDSTSYVMTSRYGSIYWPTENRPENKMVISSQSPKAKDQGKHFDTLSPLEQEACRAEIEKRGFTVEGLREEYQKRDLWNIQYFHSLCDRPLDPFFNQNIGFF